MKKATRILFVPGIHTPKWYVRWWKKDLAKKFPQSEIIFLDDVVYYYWQHEVLEKIVQQGVLLLEDGKPTVIIAHSFGGILSKAMLTRGEKMNVSFLYTLASPHLMTYAKILDAKKYIAAPEKINIPVESIGGFFDPIVPFFLSKITGGKKHENIFCEHMGFLWFPWVRKKVMRKIEKYIQKESF